MDNDDKKQPLSDIMRQAAIAERARKIGVPVLPPRRADRPAEENPVVAVCGACGIDVRKVMWMACNKAECPLSSGTVMRAPADG